MHYNCFYVGDSTLLTYCNLEISWQMSIKASFISLVGVLNQCE